MHDSVMFIPVLDGIPAIRSRRGPRRPGKLLADKGYHADELRACRRRLGLMPCIARRGIESSQRLGRHKWSIEHTISWFYRRLTLRYERKATLFAAFLPLAVTRICYKGLAKLTT